MIWGCARGGASVRRDRIRAGPVARLNVEGGRFPPRSLQAVAQPRRLGPLRNTIDDGIVAVRSPAVDVGRPPRVVILAIDPAI